MTRAKACSGFLLARPRPPKRYVLTCLRPGCGEVFDETDTLGQIHRDHFMRMHDTAKVAFTLLDRWSGRTRVLN